MSIANVSITSVSIANVDFNGSSVQTAELVGSIRAANEADREKSSDVALGIGLAAFLPALFWVGLVWAVCAGLGIAISGATLATIGFAVAVFLTIICSAMFRVA